MMKKPLDLTTLLKPVRVIFQNFHLTIFIVIIVGGLAYAVISLYGLVSDASTVPDDATTAVSQTSLDQTTITQLNQMYTSNNAPSSIQLPSGRINPFSE